MNLTETKVCRICANAAKAPFLWRCRNCGRKTCEHLCGFKTADDTAMCQPCQRIIATHYKPLRDSEQ
jgi:hypothetical protein